MQTKLRLAIAVLFGIISVCGLSAQELPFFDGFEDAGKHGEWTFVHSSSRNKWHIGTATAAQGANSLYVSADGGVTPGYANDASGIAAYITLQLPAGTYNVSFDYRVVGETDTKGVGLDSLFVYWVTDPNERIAETKGDRPEVLSVYRQQINSAEGTKDPSLWYNTTFQARVRDGSMPVRLTFYWICNSSNIVPPGACIDNIQVWAADAACATPENAKCRLYYTKDQDGLRMPWSGTVWCNPPYGRKVGSWVKKALFASAAGSTVVMLLPARTDTKWFHYYIYRKRHVEIRFLEGRLRFGGQKNAAPFPSMVVIFHGQKWGDT